MNARALCLTLTVLMGCAGGGAPALDGAALAKEVCDCTQKVNAMKADEPDRAAKMQACNDLQAKTWATVKGTDQQDAYNGVFPCGM